MSTGIGSFCTRQVVAVEPHATVVEACILMRQHHVGAVAIVDDRAGARKPVGILTDRDIAVEVVALRVAPDTIEVSEVFQRPVTSSAKTPGTPRRFSLSTGAFCRGRPAASAGPISTSWTASFLCGRARYGPRDARERRTDRSQLSWPSVSSSDAVHGHYGFGAAAHMIAQVCRHQQREVFAFIRPSDEASR
jgi:hypothetical protein